MITFILCLKKFLINKQAFSKFILIDFSKGIKLMKSLKKSISKIAVFFILEAKIFAIVDLPEFIDPLIKITIDNLFKK